MTSASLALIPSVPANATAVSDSQHVVVNSNDAASVNALSESPANAEKPFLGILLDELSGYCVPTSSTKGHTSLHAHAAPQPGQQLPYVETDNLELPSTSSNDVSFSPSLEGSADGTVDVPSPPHAASREPPPLAADPSDTVRETAQSNIDSSRVLLSLPGDGLSQGQPQHLLVYPTVARPVSEPGSSCQDGSEGEKSPATGLTELQLEPYNHRPHQAPPQAPLRTDPEGRSAPILVNDVGMEAPATDALANVTEHRGPSDLAQASTPKNQLARSVDLGSAVSNQPVSADTYNVRDDVNALTRLAGARNADARYPSNPVSAVGVGGNVLFRSAPDPTIASSADRATGEHELPHQLDYRIIADRSLHGMAHMPANDRRTLLGAPLTSRTDASRAGAPGNPFQGFERFAAWSLRQPQHTVVTETQDGPSIDGSRSPTILGDPKPQDPPARAPMPSSVDVAGNRAAVVGPEPFDSLEDVGVDVEGRRQGLQSAEAADSRGQPRARAFGSGDTLQDAPLTAALGSPRMHAAAAGNHTKPGYVLSSHEPSQSVDLTSSATGLPSIHHESAVSGHVTERPSFLTGAPDQTPLARWGTADRLSDSIGAWYATSPNETNARLEVQLNPPELGRVVVRLEKARGKVAAKLLVSSEAARIAVERELPAVQQSLEEAGVELDEFDVTQHSDHQRDERPDDGLFPDSRWSEGEKADTSRSTPAQMGETAAGRVDLRV